jgi:integrase
MGLYKRKSTYWISFKDSTGKRIWESTGTNNKKFAEQIYAKRVTEATEGKILGVSNISMTEVLDRFMLEISPTMQPSTQIRNACIVNNLRTYFRDYQIGKVTTALVSQYKALCLEKGFKRETIRRELGLLRRIFNIAKSEWEICRENPVPGALRTLGRTDNNRVRYLSEGESTRLMVAMPEWLKPMVIIARHTGLRRGNLVALTWEQVDLQRKVLIIPQTKNGEAIGLPMTETAFNLLSELPRLGAYVFCHADGKPYSPLVVSGSFLDAGRRARIPNLRFHDLRHDYASKLVQGGVPIQVVKELLGHKDMRMTLRYAHLEMENLRAAVKVLG